MSLRIRSSFYIRVLFNFQFLLSKSENENNNFPFASLSVSMTLRHPRESHRIRNAGSFPNTTQ